MKKEEVITKSIEIYSSSMNETISKIAEEAFDAGFEEGYAKAKQEIGEAENQIVNLDGIEYHDIKMSDGSLVGLIDEKMPFLQASKYALPTVEQMKELLNKTRVVDQKLIFPDGFKITVSNDFFWCADSINETSEVHGIEIYWSTQHSERRSRWTTRFTGKLGRVLVIKSK